MTVHRTRTFGAVAGVLIGVLVVALLVAIIRTWTLADEIRDAQKVNTGVLTAIDKVAGQIDSCTDPEGACAKRGQRNTGKAVEDIALRQVAAVACADRPGTQTPREIKACVERSLQIFTTTTEGKP